MFAKKKITNPNPTDHEALRRMVSSLEQAIDYNCELDHEDQPIQNYLVAKYCVLKKAVKRLEAIERAYG